MLKGGRQNYLRPATHEAPVERCASSTTRQCHCFKTRNREGQGYIIQDGRLGGEEFLLQAQVTPELFGEEIAITLEKTSDNLPMTKQHWSHLRSQLRNEDVTLVEGP